MHERLNRDWLISAAVGLVAYVLTFLMLLVFLGEGRGLAPLDGLFVIYLVAMWLLPAWHRVLTAAVVILMWASPLSHANDLGALARYGWVESIQFAIAAKFPAIIIVVAMVVLIVSDLFKPRRRP